MGEITIELPNGYTASFPEGTPSEIVSQQIAKNFGHLYKPLVQRESFADASWGEVGRESWNNFLPSAGRAIGDVVGAIISPLETAKALGNVALGGVQKLIPGEQDAEQYADAVGQYFGDRYGSMDGFKKTLALDPFGALSDLSTVFTGGSGALKGIGAMSKAVGAANVGGKIGSAGSALNTMARAVDPLTAVTAPVAGIGKAMLGGTPISERLYGSALKPTLAKDFTLEDRQRALRTGIDERIMPTVKGFESLENKISGLNDNILDIITKKGAEGAKINARQIADNAFDQTAQRFMTVNPGADMDAIANAIDGFETWHGSSSGIPLEVAQKLKQNTYKTLKDKAYKGEIKTAGVEAEKALARGLKEEIARLAPEVAELNARESSLLKLSPLIEKAVGRSNNWDIFSLPALTSGGLGASIGGPAGAAATAAVVQLSRNPAFKTHAAFAADRMSKIMGKVMGNPNMELLMSSRRPATAAAYAGERTKDNFSELLKRYGYKK